MTTQDNTEQAAYGNTENGLTERSQNWVNNHETIKRALGRLIRSNKRWPSKDAIAVETGLGRNTIYRHMEEFSKDDMMQNELEELKFISSHITATMVDQALDGDIRAMRLSYKIMGVLKKGRATTAPVEKKV